MNKAYRLALCIVLAAALGVMAFLGAGILQDARQLRGLEHQLADSRAAWQDTAERKEALQAELKAVTEALKEATLTLEESAARAEELRQEIAALEKEVAALKEAAGE